jgi:3-deoxy-D-manno-octulosonic-acid transferase
VFRASKAVEYRQRVAERFGFFKSPDFEQAPIWVHAVSVGESLAIAPMVKALQQRYPSRPIVMTCMTPTGSERIQAMFGDSVFHVYAPYDLFGSVRRFYRKLNPALAIFVETEVWPNMVSEAHKRGIPTVLANARMSEKSAKGYAKLGWVTRPVFAKFTAVLAQNELDGKRLLALGVSDKALNVTGSIKFDMSLDEALREQARELRVSWNAAAGLERPVWIAASTHAGEDEQVLVAHKQLLKSQPEALLVLVPRHPERFDTVAQLIASAGFSAARRTQETPPRGNQQVLLADTMGEMMLLLGTADVAFVGGSLVPRGGHNVLEPAAWALPVLCGPHLFNFQVISELLMAAGNLQLVESSDALAVSLLHFFSDKNVREAAGQAGVQVVDQNRGALQRQLQALDHLLASSQSFKS